MRPIQHKSSNRVLGAPPGWNQGELPCSALAITDGHCNGVPCVISFWRPTPAELLALVNGGNVMLCVIGSNMPPVNMEVVP